VHRVLSLRVKHPDREVAHPMYSWEAKNAWIRTSSSPYYFRNGQASTSTNLHFQNEVKFLTLGILPREVEMKTGIKLKKTQAVCMATNDLQA
jgi:hypothetical protein